MLLVGCFTEIVIKTIYSVFIMSVNELRASISYLSSLQSQKAGPVTLFVKTRP